MSQLVVGLGNLLRGDDGAGLAVERQVCKPAREVTDPGCLLDMWGDDDDVIIIDAVSSGAPVGTIHRIDVGESPLPLASVTSSHAFGLAEVIELARSLGKLPRSILVYGIEVRRAEPGSTMTPPVIAAVKQLTKVIDGA